MYPSFVCPWQMNPHIWAAYASWLSPHLPPRNLFGDDNMYCLISAVIPPTEDCDLIITSVTDLLVSPNAAAKPSHIISPLMLRSYMWVRKYMFCFSVFLVFLLSVCFSDIKLATQDQSPITQYSSKIFLHSPTKKHCLYFSPLSTWGVLPLHLTVVPLWVYYVCPRFLFSSLCTLTFHHLPFTLILSFHFFHSGACTTLLLWPVVISSFTSYLTVTMCCISISFSPFSFSWTTSSSGFIVHILKDPTWRSNLIRKQDDHQSQKCHSAHQEWEQDASLGGGKKRSYYICSYFIQKITTHDWNFTLELTKYQTCSHGAWKQMCVYFGQTDCTLTLSRRGTCQMKSCSVCGSNSAGPGNVDIHVSLTN